VLGEGRPQRRTVVVVAGHQVDRAAERREQSAQLRVLVGAAEVGEVPRDHDRVGRLGQAPDCSHRPLEECRGVDTAIGELAGQPDVGVAELDEKLLHGEDSKGWGVPR